MGCIWDSDAPRAPIPLRDTRLQVVHRALSKWAGERGVKEPSPPWTSPRVKPPMPQCATPRRLRFAEGLLYTTQQTSQSEQPAFCAGQPPTSQLVGKPPGENGMPRWISRNRTCGCCDLPSLVMPSVCMMYKSKPQFFDISYLEDKLLNRRGYMSTS